MAWGEGITQKWEHSPPNNVAHVRFPDPASYMGWVCWFSALACVSQKTRKLYGSDKPFVKLRPAYSVKLVLLYVVKGIKVKITAKFRDREHFRFEDTKRIMSPGEFRVFRETGLCTERFSAGTPVSPLLKNQHLTWFVLIVNFCLQCPQLMLQR